MFPLKDNRMDYMAEINRLFPKTNENDLQTANIFNSTYSQSPNHSIFANRSSSSDSTSPESYPDIFTAFQRTSDLYNLRPETPLQSLHPLGIRPQRPIVGRRILNTENSRPLPNRSNDDLLMSNSWIDDFTHPKSNLFEQNQIRNYELFPTDKYTPLANQSPIASISPTKSNFSTFSPIKSHLSTSNFSPIKSHLSTSNFSPNKSNFSTATFSPYESNLTFSPTQSNLPTSTFSPNKSNPFSPIECNLSTSNFSPNLSTATFSPYESNLTLSPTQSNLSTATFSPMRSNLSTSTFSMSSSMMDSPSSPMLIPNCAQSYTPNMSDFSPPGFSRAGASKVDEISAQKMCKFCRRNGETPLVYMTHCVKERVGKKHIVTCPILRSHVCSACGATGDKAHTITYCPLIRSSNNGKRLESTTITLKNTRIMSNGKRRY